MRFALLVLTLLSISAIAAADTVTMTARPLSVFAQSFGVNTHREQGLELNDLGDLAAELRGLGVSTLRIANPSADQPQIAAGGVAANQDFYVHLAQAAGLRYVVFIASAPVLADELAAARVLARAGVLRGIEGINEANNFAVSYGGRTSRTDDGLLEGLQADLYRAVKADPVLSKFPVYDYTGPARLHGYPRTGRADYATIHPYSSHGEATRYGAGVATRGGIQAVNVAQNYTGRVTAKVITENGYAAPPENGSTNAVSLADEGGLIEMMVSDAVLDGFDMDLVYDLTDAPGDLYGFYDHGHRLKPSGIEMGHFMQLMADPGTVGSTTTEVLALSFSDMPSTARRMLFVAGDGTKVLELWNEPTTPAPAPITIGLPKHYDTVTVFDGLTGASVSSARDADRIAVTLPNHPIIIKLK